MFRQISDDLKQAAGQAASSPVESVTFTFDGRSFSTSVGNTLATALLENGIAVFRETPISGARRGPYCLMGVCFECLVVVDGIGNRQACLTLVRGGMAVETQHGSRNVDALEAQNR